MTQALPARATAPIATATAASGDIRPLLLATAPVAP